MPHRAVVLTVVPSGDGATAADQSGPAIIEQLPLLDAGLIHREAVPAEIDRIRAAVQTWLGRCDLILVAGGTGVSERDVTPEAIEPLVERGLPGFGEVVRLRAFDRMPESIVFRSGAGVARNCLIVWLPGSAGILAECLAWLAPAIRHVCAAVRGEPAASG